MKIKQINFFFLILISCIYDANAQTTSRDVLMREGELPAFMGEVQHDKNLQLERLSSYYFHQLINKYRIENKIKTLYWDERLWLAARNHNLYQAGIADIDHTEQVKNGFFSGRQPEDRVKYVTYNMQEIEGVGENVLYHYSHEGTSLEETAMNIAKASFQQWKDSPPHNANMLDEDYFSHGTSLVVSKDGKVFGTTVFAFKYDFEEQEITLHWDTVLAKRNPPSFVINGESFDQWEWNSGYAEKKLFALVKGKMPLAKTSIDKGMQLAAQKHLLYLKSNKIIGCEESSKNNNYYGATTKKRYMKATKYKSLFFTLFHTIGEKSFVYDCTMEELKNKSIFAKIEKELQTEFSERNKIKNWGVAVAFYEKENQYQCIIDVVWVEK